MMKIYKVTSGIKKYKFLFMIMLCAAGLLLILADKKSGMHIDEYYSYGLANSTYDSNHGSIYIALQNGVKMSPEAAFDKYFFADSFSLKDVWNNQKNDTHPPLYYLVFHIWGLITNNFWGLKTGILLNIIFHLCNIFLVYQIIFKLIKKEEYALLGSLLYAILPISLGNVIFIRMYALSETSVLVLILIFLIYWNSSSVNKSFYVLIGLISVGGILTHYYFLIYLFYICVAWEMGLLIRRKWKDMALFALTMIGTGVVSYVIFPYMKYHILHGSRGTESIERLLHSSYMDNLQYYWGVLWHVTGNILPIMLIAALLLLLYRKVKHSDVKVHFVGGGWSLIMVPTVLYFLTISKIAVMQSSRYVSVLYGPMVILLMGLLGYILCDVKNIKMEMAILIIFVGIILGKEWKEYDWPELYLDETARIEISKEYAKDNECIFVYEDAWHTMKSYQELIEYENISFIPIEQLNLLDTEEYQNYYHVVIFIDDSIEVEQQSKIINKMIESNPDLSTDMQLYDNEYATTYFLR